MGLVLSTEKRGERRHHRERLLIRAARLWKLWRSRGGKGDLMIKSPAEMRASIAHIFETHGRPCSCWMCDVHKQGRREHPPSGNTQIQNLEE